MTHEKNLLSMPSPLHSPASWRVLPCSDRAAYRDDRGRPARAGFLTRNDSRYQRDISREVSVSASGELIIGLRNFASDRWKLRKYDLSTDVDKAVSNSNLNHDFRLPALGTGSGGRG